jgi:hypothetical protein
LVSLLHPHRAVSDASSLSARYELSELISDGPSRPPKGAYGAPLGHQREPAKRGCEGLRHHQRQPKHTTRREHHCPSSAVRTMF